MMQSGLAIWADGDTLADCCRFSILNREAD